MLLGKDNIGAFASYKSICVNADTTVCIRKWTAKERLEYYDLVTNAQKDSAEWYTQVNNIMCWVIAHSVCDTSGARVYDTVDEDKIGSLDGELLDIIYDNAMIYNGLKDGEMKVAIKN